MIKLKTLTIQNFQSTGNKPVVFNLDSGKLILISGKNGDGKSVIVDAITYVIYGTPHRKEITLSDLINRTNKEGTLVTLELTNGKTEYKLKRGMKPDVLEIYKNGEYLNKLSSKKVIQE